MIHHFIITLLLLSDSPLKIMAGFALLVPSQIPGAKHTSSRQQHHRRKQKQEEAAREATLLQSSAVTAHDQDDEADSLVGEKTVYRSEFSRREEHGSSTPSPSSTSRSHHKKKKNTRNITTTTAASNNKKATISIPRTGNLPDVHWRAISMSHLRSHPNFQPLPPPSMIHSIPTREHVRYFRQDSWQWDYLHVGRCTTSQCSAALGFLEPKAAEYLGIPKSLQRGGTSAWERLRQVPEHDQSLQTMERILCEGRSKTHDNDKPWRPGMKETDRLWIPASKLRTISGIQPNKPYPFSAKYIPTLTNDELFQRKLHVKEHHQSPSPMKTRMHWGNAQEATSILTALNYFCGVDSDTVIHEVGMCGAKFDDEGVDNDASLLNGVKIGASPDAIIVHGNGTVEVLEVKNHCPFVWNRISPHSSNGTSRSNHSSNRHRRQNIDRKHKNKSEEQRPKEKESGLPKHYLIRDFQLERRIPPVYIPQLMMEILCVGDSVHPLDQNVQANSTASTSSPICTSAIMVRQTATKGAILLRLKRDEQWIQEMKYWLGKFKLQYVDTDRIPDDDFFWNDDPNSRYRKFLNRTKELSESVEQVAFIEHGRIQRMVLDRGVGRGEVPLFLDRVDNLTE